MSKQEPVLRIGHVPYADSAVFYSQMPRDKVELITLQPRKMADAMKRGVIDAGPLPIYEVLKMGDSVAPLLDFGVAAHSSAENVLLFAHACIHELSGKSIGVSHHTSTSVQLLRILLADLWKARDVDLVDPSRFGVGELMIGDEALEFAQAGASGGNDYTHIYDLGEQWHLLTGLPFVFARWVARKDADVDRITAVLERSFEHGIDRIEELAASYDIGFIGDMELAEYMDNFTHRLDEEEYQAIEEFRSRLATLPEWEPPLNPYKSTRKPHERG